MDWKSYYRQMFGGRQAEKAGRVNHDLWLLDFSSCGTQMYLGKEVWYFGECYSCCQVH